MQILKIQNLFSLFKTSKFYLCKVYSSAAEATKDIKDGAYVCVGGFGLGGTPNALIEAIRDHGIQNLTVAANDCGVNDWGLGHLLQSRQIKRFILSFVGENKVFEK